MYYIKQIECKWGVIECNTKVAMKTIGEARNLKTKSKMAESRFALSDEIVVGQLKLKCEKTKHYLINTNVVKCLFT